MIHFFSPYIGSVIVDRIARRNLDDCFRVIYGRIDAVEPQLLVAELLVRFKARIGLHIPVRQAQVERRSFARFERFRTADFIRSIVRYRPVAGMDAQPAVARSVGREFLRKEKRI